MASTSAKDRAAAKGIGVVSNNTNLAQKIEPELPDGEDGGGDNSEAMAAAMMSVAMATKCFVASPQVGDPVALAKRFYDFIFE